MHRFILLEPLFMIFVLDLSEKATLFMPNDPLLKMFRGFNYLFVGKEKQGINLLREIKGMTFEEAVSTETLPEDFLDGQIDREGLKSIFLSVDATRDSIVSP